MARQAFVLLCTGLIAGALGAWAVEGTLFLPGLVVGLVLVVAGAVWVRRPGAHRR